MTTNNVRAQTAEDFEIEAGVLKRYKGNGGDVARPLSEPRNFRKSKSADHV